MTDIERRVTDRIGLIVDDAEYRGKADALEDSWRVALLASVPGASVARDRARADAVWRANVARDPGARRPRTARRRHRVLLLVVFLIGASAVAVIAPSPRTGHVVFDLQHGALLAGVLATVAAAALYWLEPLRASGDLAGRHIPARAYLVFAFFWIGIAASGAIFRFREIDRGAETAPVIGLILLAAAGISQIVLWRLGRRADLTSQQGATGYSSRGLIDERDDDAVLAALDAWWAAAGPDAERADAPRLEAARAAAIRRLADAGFLDPTDVHRALRESPPTTWRERRP